MRSVRKSGTAVGGGYSLDGAGIFTQNYFFYSLTDIHHHHHHRPQFAGRS